MTPGDWDHEARSVFRDARLELAPTDGSRDRVRAKLTAALGATALATGSDANANAARPDATPRAWRTWMRRGVAVVGVGVVALVSARMLASGRPSPSPAAPSAVSTSYATASSRPREPPTVEAVPASTVEAPPAAEAPPPPATSAPSAKPRVTSSGRLAATDDEVVLVSRIDAALRRGDASAALALVDEHARRFPQGLLVEEREAARVVVRCTTGGGDAAARAFLASHPRSPMRTRIEAACRKNEGAR